MRNIENPNIFVKVLDPIRGISKKDRKLAQEVEESRPGEGKVILQTIAGLNRYSRNAFRK